MNYIKNRINSIRVLNKDRNFAPAILLGGKAIIILSFFLAMQTISFFTPLDNSLDKVMAQNSFVLFSCYVGLFVIILGKEIIQIHMLIFSKLDSILRKAVDSYSMKYWKKNRKDSKFLTKFAATQMKLFKPLSRLDPKKRNALVFGVIMTYLVLDYMRFGLLQILAASLAQFFAMPEGGIKIAS